MVGYIRPHQAYLIRFRRRRQERNDSTFSIWPASPKGPHRDEEFVFSFFLILFYISK